MTTSPGTVAGLGEAGPTEAGYSVLGSLPGVRSRIKRPDESEKTSLAGFASAGDCRFAFSWSLTDRNLDRNSERLLSTGKENVVMDFRPLNDVERQQLIASLRGNVENDRAILIDRRDTSFAGIADEVPDDEVINAIKSVPCHY